MTLRSRGNSSSALPFSSKMAWPLSINAPCSSLAVTEGEVVISRHLIAGLGLKNLPAHLAVFDLPPGVVRAAEDDPDKGRLLLPLIDVTLQGPGDLLEVDAHEVPGRLELLELKGDAHLVFRAGLRPLWRGVVSPAMPAAFTGSGGFGTSFRTIGHVQGVSPQGPVALGHEFPGGGAEIRSPALIGKDLLAFGADDLKKADFVLGGKMRPLPYSRTVPLK